MKINCNKIRRSEEKLLKFNLKAEKKNVYGSTATYGRDTEI